jgi:hypothetical protein
VAGAAEVTAGWEVVEVLVPQAVIRVTQTNRIAMGMINLFNFISLKNNCYLPSVSWPNETLVWIFSIRKYGQIVNKIFSVIYSWNVAYKPFLAG